ncbi:MAG: SUMF1/EgtB/PvdO family nonheme iron enzyme [Calditrichaceae bacterium]|nr:SUMF1/EgtB/PvdO family nonheme iron enzyme [Calditrichia bacterium]NUQ43295.1 SUMF1/EgtB/PvdO family nonheme iron enzyme [Calditrichaceae bacterium]
MGIDWMVVATVAGSLVGLAGLLFGIYQRRQRIRDKKKETVAQLETQQEYREEQAQQEAKTVQEEYCELLQDELGKISLAGSPAIATIPVNLLDVFVSLRISSAGRAEDRIHPGQIPGEVEAVRDLGPAELMKRAFTDYPYRLLLIIGEAGSGKTTLLQYYALKCLHKGGFWELGFSEPVLPIYFPLRELASQEAEPGLLPQYLAKWAQDRQVEIPAENFYSWLHERPTLLLLDGLDEISEVQQRKKACRWIDRARTGLKKAHFVVTSRETGYRKLEGIELNPEGLLRADVRDFSPPQQKEFLDKWFRAAFLKEIPADAKDRKTREERQLKRAEQRARDIIDFLHREENRAVQQLAAVPMLLQIMAIIWKEREFLPRSRRDLYDAALNYLLEYRDDNRGLKPLLPAESARRVLLPAALWMQEEKKRDNVLKSEMHLKMQPTLNTLPNQYPAETFCNNLRDRAGLLSDPGKDVYIFRHKSFREYLAGEQLATRRNESLPQLIRHFGEDWWQEPLRFFISKADDQMFDSFMKQFFRSPKSHSLGQKEQNLLQTLVREAGQTKIDSLKAGLNDDTLNDRQRRYILECLKTIGTPEALGCIVEFIKKRTGDQASRRYAEELTVEMRAGVSVTDVLIPRNIFETLPLSFRNPYEDHAEYMLIPGGAYKYSVSKKNETVPNLYFAKYPLTNKRYRRFIDYLAGVGAIRESPLLRALPPEQFARRLLAKIGPEKDFIAYLGKNPAEWAGKLRSNYDDDRRFNGEDQPVVGVTWFAAAVYCHWLTEIQLAIGNSQSQEGMASLLAIANSNPVFRLPSEPEWEWAAAGREPGGELREYPWPKEKGAPNPQLANYGDNVGATTPVGRYPEGATPEGLMDMAGNVWEWCENLYGKGAYREDARALRGGAWSRREDDLRCSARYHYYPGYWDFNIGFRVVVAQS